MHAPLGQVAQRRLALVVGLSAQTAVAAMPASLKTRAMNRACSTLTQKPSARIAREVVDAARRAASTTSRAQASSPVSRLVRPSTS